MIKHELLEKNSGLMLLFTLVIISIGGLIEIVPLFYINNTVETVKVNGLETVRPYTPLEQLGRDLYVREGCYNCHSQMIRPFRDEQLRYGHYSLAAESKFDHPFQWGSKRTGPDLARVGGKYSNQWQVEHLKNPRSFVPQSIMPNYGWLATNELDYKNVATNLSALRLTGVPYSKTEEEYTRNVTRFGEGVAQQLDIAKAVENLEAQVKKGNYDGNPDKITEMDAMVAYLQVLGTMVDFKQFEEGCFSRFRSETGEIDCALK